MARTSLFNRLLRTMRIARLPMQAKEAVEAANAAEQADHRSFPRRDLLKLGGVTAAALATPKWLAGCALEGPSAGNAAGLRASNADIGIVGAGLAGLACAYELKRKGILATIHEASDRVGGRVYSMGGAFPGPVDWLGQVIERGAELIDTPHKTMIGYANEFGFALEDVAKPKRDTFYRFGGQMIPEHVMVDEYRVLVDSMRDTLRTVGSPTADSSTPQDRAIDQISLAEWLDASGAPSNIKALLSVAYMIEYGVPTDEMSCLAFLMFAKASRQSKMRLWGNFSDERYHVVGGNQQIPVALAERLPGRLRFGRQLLAARKRSDGKIELTFNEGGTTTTVAHDAVVLTLPFHLIRNLSLDASLGIPAWKQYAIDNAICGNNAKLMVGFVGQPWVEQGSNGAAYSDMAHLQTTWEANPSLANASRAVITDYTGAELSLSMTDANAQQHCDSFLNDFDLVYPGAKARARRTSSGQYVCHLEPWPHHALTQGAYTANAPGYFTTILGNEAKPVGNLYFAGESTDSFYSWQGFMEGAALSGLRAAGEILRDF